MDIAAELYRGNNATNLFQSASNDRHVAERRNILFAVNLNRISIYSF